MYWLHRIKKARLASFIPLAETMCVCVYNIVLSQKSSNFLGMACRTYVFFLIPTSLRHRLDWLPTAEPASFPGSRHNTVSLEMIKPWRIMLKTFCIVLCPQFLEMQLLCPGISDALCSYYSQLLYCAGDAHQNLHAGGQLYRGGA